MKIGLLTFDEPRNDTSRKIIHLDMDAFYASVEIRDNPSLADKPVIIARHPRETGGKGIVVTANYVARRYGVHSAMSAQQAWEACPQAVFVTPRMHYYREVSRQIRAVFERYTDKIEPVALDEAYLDVTQNKVHFSSATLIARQIQQQIWTELGLTCSAGVSYNKFIAKIASDYRKPAGLTVIPPAKAQTFLLSLPIEKFHGVGHKTAEKLREIGIQNGADLYQKNQEELIREFGKMGFSLYLKVRGIHNEPVEFVRERKSVGREQTYSPFIFEEAAVVNELKKLAAEVEAALSRNRLHGRVIVLKVRYGDFETFTRQKSYPDFIRDKEEIYDKVVDLWEKNGQLEREIRLLGITVTQLMPVEFENISLPLWPTENF